MLGCAHAMVHEFSWFAVFSGCARPAPTRLFDTAGASFFSHAIISPASPNQGKSAFSVGKGKNETFLESIASEASKEIGIILPFDRFRLLTACTQLALKALGIDI